MKLAVLSDIHGNEHALDAVLNDIARQKADKVLVLGDSITDFAQATRAVLNKVRQHADYVIRGNREGYMLKWHAGEYGDLYRTHKQFSCHLKAYEMLTESDLAYIAALPKQISLVFDDAFSLRMVHGSPFSESDVIREEASELLARSAAATAESILLCGHTHKPMVKEINGKTIINVGSVGLNFDKSFSAQYTLITYESGLVHIDMRKVPYDFEAFKRTCDLSDTWVRVCLKCIEDGGSYGMRFLKEAADLCGTFPIPNDAWDAMADAWIEKGMLSR